MDNELNSGGKSANSLPNTGRDLDSQVVKQYEIESRLTNGETWASIAKSESCSHSTIAKVQKAMNERNKALESSTMELMRSRMLLTANKALGKLSTTLDSEDDLKAIQGTFNGMFDRLKGTNDRNEQTINIQLGNMFATSPSSMADMTAVSAEAESPE
jgi:hypothetical protein